MKIMPSIVSFTALCAVLACGLPPAGAASTRVAFVSPERYADVDRFSDESSRAMRAIESTIASLADRYLPPNAMLRVEVLDLDLAGRLVPSVRAGRDIRVERGLSSPAVMRLHYVLEQDGRVVADREETIHGLSTTVRPDARRTDQSFPDERLMLDQWFRRTFAEGRNNGAGGH
ncbi:DUF3016 domain-containing protein [Noviherbaspirillum galbum]|uniref:DUF3016 domain-containing protein n=1 Tax=Noviherbaspirillum galbum TaxID=2709383 RepID=A0A6B3SGF0_9BURK|nr:DUF3016 domain-containing protein [Noviherbaspirillum galbum]NEX59957.1 DUF3016 domain-containing protein [Noviherbaspirillum galbum]